MPIINPETAGVEPVALAEAFLRDMDVNLSCWPREKALRVAAIRVLGPVLWSTAAREDGEAARKAILAAITTDQGGARIWPNHAAAVDAIFAALAATRPAPEQAPERVERKSGEGWTIGEVMAEMLAVAVASLECEEDDPLLEDWPVDCRADVDRWQAVIRDALKAFDYANCGVGEGLLDLAREAAARYYENDPLDKARKGVAKLIREGGRYDGMDATQLAVYGARAALAAMPTSEAIRADERGRILSDLTGEAQ